MSNDFGDYDLEDLHPTWLHPDGPRAPDDTGISGTMTREKLEAMRDSAVVTIRTIDEKFVDKKPADVEVNNQHQQPVSTVNNTSGNADQSNMTSANNVASVFQGHNSIETNTRKCKLASIREKASILNHLFVQQVPAV